MSKPYAKKGGNILNPCLLTTYKIRESWQQRNCVAVFIPGEDL